MTSTSRHRRPDSGADYNAFGRDPQGRIAYLCALFFGPNYIPLVPASQFGGRVVPPRYGPPAHYQRACLPQDFVVQSPPNYDADLPDLARMDSSWFLEPPKIFDPSAFNAVVCLAVFLRGNQAAGWNALGNDHFNLRLEGDEEFDDGTDTERPVWK